MITEYIVAKIHHTKPFIVMMKGIKIVNLSITQRNRHRPNTECDNRYTKKVRITGTITGDHWGPLGTASKALRQR